MLLECATTTIESKIVVIDIVKDSGSDIEMGFISKLKVVFVWRLLKTWSKVHYPRNVISADKYKHFQCK